MSMFIALDHNGRLTTIDKASRGLACQCYCASCGEPVIARKGLIREHHFAHHSNKDSCFIQRESLLHLYAKEVIRDALGLQLPPEPGIVPSSADPTSWWDFEGVEEEVPQWGFQPDLVAQLKDGSQLFIEVAVTSFIGDEKLERIKQAGTRTIEIDLREQLFTQHAIPSEAVKNAILKQTKNKAWIFPEPPAIFLPTSQAWQSPESPSQPMLQPEAKFSEQRFTIMGMWVSVRTLPSGSIAVRSWSYNPQITELLKSWRNQLGGEYNPKYRNWIYHLHAKEEVMARLQGMNQSL
ncbi:competence protein CoiA family protein [Pseudomonas sp. N040]|uniref:competence protein CoiA family protein n=1 Tax=Pseudomonas sp. N040 TaxID=2785325 RepID=UPI0018A33B68|nr:competence protein CoiA family protein [Pseudomonas sp. N040]MBF7731105.1 hypothetical protein [Pseudomonas sp. N040]MBW7014748.1 hypothetical protein [Pseudomonas sp. N040]